MQLMSYVCALELWDHEKGIENDKIGIYVRQLSAE